MLEILPQVLWYSLLASAIYALIAVGLTLTFGVLEFINFAHGEMATIGAYGLFGLWIVLKLPYFVAFILVALGASLFGIILEKITFKRMRKSHPFKPLVVSIGVSVLIQAVVVIVFGGGVKSYRQSGEMATKTLSFFNGNLVITESQIFLIVTTIILLIAIGIFLKYSRTGKAIRAVADNREVAAILGIKVDKIISIIFLLGSGLAAIAGMLIGAEQNLNSNMGLSLSVKAFVVIVLGGLGNVTGAIVGALIIGFSENFLVAFTAVPQSLKDAVVFCMLILILFIRPNGILGENFETEARK